MVGGQASVRDAPYFFVALAREVGVPCLRHQLVVMRGRDDEHAAGPSEDLLMDAAGFPAAIIPRTHGHLAHAKITFEQIQLLDTSVLVARVVRPWGHPHHRGRESTCLVIEEHLLENAR